MNRKILFCILLGIFLLGFFILFSQPHQITEYDTSKLKILTKNLNINKMDFRYPVIEGYSDKDIEEKINAALWKPFVHLKNAVYILDSEKFHFTGDYVVETYREDFLSLSFHTTAEHLISGFSYRYEVGINIDLSHGIILEEEDILILSQETQEFLHAELRKELSNTRSYEEFSEEELSSFTRSFCVSKEGLLVYYNLINQKGVTNTIMLKITDSQILNDICLLPR